MICSAIYAHLQWHTRDCITIEQVYISWQLQTFHESLPWMLQTITYKRSYNHKHCLIFHGRSRHSINLCPQTKIAQMIGGTETDLNLTIKIYYLVVINLHHPIGIIPLTCKPSALAVREITKSSSTFSATNISSNMTWFFQLHGTIKMKSNHTGINYNHKNIAIRSHIMIYNSL